MAVVTVGSVVRLPTPGTAPLDAARVYIGLGWAVVPCCRLAPGDPPQCSAERAGYDTHRDHGLPDAATGKVRAGKVATRTWQGRAVTTLDDAAVWWGYGARSHGPNVALLMGPGRLVALDVDGPDGDARLVEAEAALGQLPATLVNVTGRLDGGRHLLFTLPADAAPADVKQLMKSCTALRIDGQQLVQDANSPGLDLRAGDLDAGGSYIMVAPSVHPSGGRYEWRGGPIAELPRLWFDALPRRSRQRELTAQANLPLPPHGQRHSAYFARVLLGETSTVRAADTGARNDTLNAATLRVWRVAQAGEVDRAQVEAAMVEAGVAAGLSPGEATRTVESAMRAGDAQGPAAIADRQREVRHGR